MSLIGVTGDVHGDSRSISKLSAKNFKLGRTLTKDDVIIITGDFGFLWETKESDKEKYWLDWLNDKPFTVAFCCGNHENFDRLNSLDADTRFGSSVGIVRDSVYHLKRGHIYRIADNDIFCMGGGLSIDKAHRLKMESGYKYKRIMSPDGYLRDEYVKTNRGPKPRTCWWPEEYPNSDEWDLAWKNLAKVDFRVDYIISHVPPSRFTNAYAHKSHHRLSDGDIVGMLLQDIYDVTTFKCWYHGHCHVDEFASYKVCCVYNSILKIND